MTDAPVIKEVLNKNIDVGSLLIEDCRAYGDLSQKETEKYTQENLSQIYRVLFELQRQQRAEAGGEDGEILEYTKSKYTVDLPLPNVVLPREKPIPKPKPLTKWEKFRLEKGIAPKAKRSRMVFDPITQDWVPRFGLGSVKKIEDKYNWVMEEKDKHVAAGVDPFTYKKNQKKLEMEKQNLRELKNKIVSSGPAGLGKKMANDQILDNSDATKAPPAEKASLKARDDMERDRLRKRERKALLKSLQMAQMSTASMGKFDKKVNKYEPDAPNSLKKPKKKSNS
jgi:regulator of ribosome biosynthesis